MAVDIPMRSRRVGPPSSEAVSQQSGGGNSRSTVSSLPTSEATSVHDGDDLHVLIGSFNLATRGPNIETGEIPNLLTWLRPPADSSAAHRVKPDIVVVGFQELVSQFLGARLPLGGSCHGDVSLVEKADTGRLDFLDPWIRLVQDELHNIYGDEGGDASKSGLGRSSIESEEDDLYYEPYLISRMVGLGLILFVRRGSGARHEVEAVWEGDIGTGLLGKYPNKGCVAVGLDLQVIDAQSNRSPVSICFGNSHLGPHEGFEPYEWRNEEVQHIFETLLLEKRAIDSGHHRPHHAHHDPSSSEDSTRIRLLSDFHAVFFFGDLNYRLMGAGVSSSGAWTEFRQSVLRHIDAKEVEELLSMDELSALRDVKKFKPLTGFLEAPITFIPSYKFRGEDSINTSVETNPGSKGTAVSKKTDEPSGLSSPASPKSPSSRTEMPPIPAARRFANNRVPAYCDRIMYRAVDLQLANPLHPAPADTSDDGDSGTSENPIGDAWESARQRTSSAIEPLYYHCAHSVVWSDHKPVAALYALKIDQLLSTPRTRQLTAGQQERMIARSRSQQLRRFREKSMQNTVVQIAVTLTVCVTALALWSVTGVPLPLPGAL
ncbi:Endonuclease/exonuclease/phosphatase [Fimicolochytrium jonesii]|uniref:Endonuclease/exonuclease/phosphatase n=1 Tax=Fimicolochytrium jonesii TaxID=1396493 RepID=UPI0022FEC5B3|nr:Endonuclease/exonuclease/phosphatase [Fimicolochytrium jonesii]KAI8823406.1 Endonuclease/exonuclease/phosphatase [Fimicolochytrium jonesii]